MNPQTAGNRNPRRRLDGMQIPPVIFGTSGLGNLFTALDNDTKTSIVRECIERSEGPAFFDTAGKYGAGLALECLGDSLHKLNVRPDQVIISNKLGWLRTPLRTAEQTFERGVWKDLRYDAIQKISYEGILECYEQGNTLLNGYMPRWVSVHDPDEYLATARDTRHRQQLYEDILGAYRALAELKACGRVDAVGVGAKDWRSILEIAADIKLDWVMFANSMTIRHHPPELLRFIQDLDRQGVHIINSAVFHSGFLVGGNYYDYRLVSPDAPGDKALFRWREDFFGLCRQFGIRPAQACVQFAVKIPGIRSIALNTTDPGRVRENIAMVQSTLPDAFWTALKNEGLIAADPGEEVGINMS